MACSGSKFLYLRLVRASVLRRCYVAVDFPCWREFWSKHSRPTRSERVGSWQKQSFMLVSCLISICPPPRYDTCACTCLSVTPVVMTDDTRALQQSTLRVVVVACAQRVRACGRRRSWSAAVGHGSASQAVCVCSSRVRTYVVSTAVCLAGGR